MSEEAVRKIVTRQLAFDAIQSAFEAVALDRSQMFDVAIGTGLNDGEVFVLKSGIDRNEDLAVAGAVCESARPTDQVRYIEFQGANE